jgi:hypothetical protein
MEVPFSEYGYTTNNPPRLSTSWNEQKRVVDLSGTSYVFITSLTSSPWRQRERFPNADRSTIKYYWCKYGEKRTKRSFHWLPRTSTRMGGTGAIVSSVFRDSRSVEIRNFVV